MKIVLLIFLFFTPNIFAHQPKLIKYSPSIEKPHEVIEPEISKAYYGKLTGQPHYYKVESKEDFLFYTGILTPKVSDDFIVFNVEVFDEEKNIMFSGEDESITWYAWYEPYARDWYWKGPEIGIDTGEEFKKSFTLVSGTYLIKVSNFNNLGHYSLAVGEAEFFGSNLWQQILTWTPIILYIGPYMDIVHWQKFDVRAYIPHIALLVIVFIIYLIIKKIFFRKKNILAK